MIKRLKGAFDGDGVESRAMRSSAWTGLSFFISQALRLGSNLILTRLLMPDAFGAMALVTAFMIGLVMFSDMGTSPAIQNSDRGDDPEFLNTIWTVQVIRGVTLWLIACALAFPLSVIYQEPLLAQLLPVTALGLVIGGFMPTRMDSAVRHLDVGQLTRVELISQVLGLVATVLLAVAMRSVWALVLGGVLGSVIQVLLIKALLPGIDNRFRLEAAALAELRRFGPWIFLSTICGFLVFQGDRLILGRYLSLHDLGIYNIAAMLGTLPMTLGLAVAGRLFLPLYREAPPAASPDNAARVARLRARVRFALMVIAAVLVALGPFIIGLLYDIRYADAGWQLSVIALIQMPAIAALGYDSIPLAVGNSRQLFRLQGLRALIYVPALLIGAHYGGLPGILAAQGLTVLAMYPVLLRVAKSYRADDLRSDAIILGTGLLLGVGLALTWPP